MIYAAPENKNHQKNMGDASSSSREGIRRGISVTRSFLMGDGTVVVGRGLVVGMDPG